MDRRPSCAPSPAQASKLLRALADEGSLALRGERRDSYYQRP
ncbi:hypothetical protein [Amycolatopsis aidingensis]|nr:hypothetical protein [Amycolatopsis aidingensis]